LEEDFMVDIGDLRDTDHPTTGTDTMAVIMETGQDRFNTTGGIEAIFIQETVQV
jgi:hypothetical protein